MRRCIIRGCREPHSARGFCHRHYRAFLRRGGERIMPHRRLYGATDEERFWHYVERGPRCWEWTGYKNAKGYGIMNLRGERVMAHRFAYKLQAEIPAGLYVLHHCDNAGCVKPKHLFVGTLADNNGDMFRKGRNGNPNIMLGTKNPAARLSEDDVRAIRNSAESGPILADRYSVTRTTISAIRRRLLWAHID